VTVHFMSAAFPTPICGYTPVDPNETIAMTRDPGKVRCLACKGRIPADPPAPFLNKPKADGTTSPKS